MSKKPEQYSEHNSHYLVLSAVAQFIQTIAGTWDTCSHSQKVVMLELMEQLTANATEVMAANLERSKQTNDENN